MTTSANPINPARTALLLMDFQPAVLGNAADPEAVLAAANAALSWARKENVQVGYVHVAFTEEDYGTIPARNKTFAALAQNKVLPADSPEAQIHPELEVRDDDIVVRKVRVGAWNTTGLHAELNARGIDTLILGGIATSGVVLSTLRHAADEDFRLFVLSDATADGDAEVHRVLLEKVFPRQADVITTDDLAALIDDAER
jgi:nicotinamidase-related amidase